MGQDTSSVKASAGGLSEEQVRGEATQRAEGGWDGRALLRGSEGERGNRRVPGRGGVLAVNGPGEPAEKRATIGQGGQKNAMQSRAVEREKKET